MSIERIERKDAVVWRVRWRQAGQNRSKVLGRKRDAEAFDAELRRKRRTGELAALDAGKETLAEFGQEWWKLYGEPNLAASTLKVYAILWDTHVLPRLGSLRLREITPSIVTRFRLELEAEDVGRASIHKAMTLLQGVLQRAC
jgi:Phage integrase, N-terminal SAM-like domain